ADHPEVVAFVAQLALRYRQKFGSDIVIDLICFRRYGHNELDDASFTQPLMARRIATHEPVSKIYTDRLLKAKHITEAEVEAMHEQAQAAMLKAREEARKMKNQVSQRLGGVWKGIQVAGTDWSSDTRVKPDVLEQI